MIEGLKLYPSYKETGISWLGKVPEHWEVLPGRAVFREINDRCHPYEQLLSVTITRGVLRQADLLSDSSKKDSSNEDKSNYKLVQPGDLVYNKMRAWQGAVGVSAYRGIVSPAYIIQRLRKTGNLPRYIHFLLRTPQFASEAECWSYGITSDQWSLRAEEFKKIYFPLPPLSEQSAIVRFLDYVDRRIRRVIRARQKRIKLLEEYKQVLINQAVTGQIDVRTGKPYPAYKNSGVQWLGQVPKHWEVRRLKSIANLMMGQSPPSEYCSVEPLGLPFLQGCAEFGMTHPNSKLFCCQPAKICSAGAILLSIRAPVGRLNLADQSYAIGRGLCALVPILKFLGTMFARYALLATIQGLVISSTGSTYDAVSINDIGNHFIPLPPLSEQTAIVEYLDTQTAKIDTAIATTRREIELLREFRTRLISDVVTGKVDVREVAKQLPEEPELPEEEELEPANEVEIASDSTEESVEEENADDET